MGRPLAGVIASVAVLSYATCGTGADDEPTSHAVIDRALKAGGGAEKIGQFKAVSFKADVLVDGERWTMSGLFAGPALFRMEAVRKPGETAVLVASGDRFWVKGPKGEVEEHRQGKDADKFGKVAIIFYGLSLPDRLLVLKRRTYELKILGDDSAVDGTEVITVRVKHELHPEATIDFDKASGLPLRAVLKFPKDEGRTFKLFDLLASEQVEIFFGDFKEVEGVRHFTKVTMRLDAAEIQCALREIKLHKSYDPKMFKKPE